MGCNYDSEKHNERYSDPNIKSSIIKKTLRNELTQISKENQ